MTLSIKCPNCGSHECYEEHDNWLVCQNCGAAFYNQQEQDQNE